MSDAIVRARDSLIKSMIKISKEEHKFYKFMSVIRSVQQKKEKYVAESANRPGRVSYAQKPNYIFDTRRRTRTTLGRYLRRNHKNILIRRKITDSELDLFVGKVIADLTKIKGKFKLLYGKDVERAYASCIGSSSCMTGTCAIYTRIYADNPDRVGLLVLDENKARALIWTTDVDIKLMDRIYPNHGQHIPLYEKWAKENNVFIRRHNGAPGSEIDFLGTKTLHHIITLDEPSNGMYPYMDSFRYAQKENDKVIVRNNQHPNYSYMLNSTDGAIYEEQTMECRECGVIMNEDEAIYPINSDTNAHCRDCVICCDWCSEYCTSDYVEYIDGYGEICEYCKEQEFTSCENCGKDVVNGDTLESVDGWICMECELNSYFECNCCGNLVNETCKNDVDKSNNSVDLVCDGCLDSHYEECEKCGAFNIIGDECCNDGV